MAACTTTTFLDGDSVAVRLPEEFGFAAGSSVEIEQFGDGIRIRPSRAAPVRDAAATRKLLEELIHGLNAIGRPGIVEQREPIEPPDRPGLY
jgi:virulence-associated protein VagC